MLRDFWLESLWEPFWARQSVHVYVFVYVRAAGGICAGKEIGNA